MKQQKAKWYPSTGMIIPIEIKPNLVSLDVLEDPIPDHGLDENGEWKLVNYVSGPDQFFEYAVKKEKVNGAETDKVSIQTIKEEEWNQNSIDIENTQETSLSVHVAPSFLKKFASTSLNLLQAIYKMVKKSITRVMQLLCFGA